MQDLQSCLGLGKAWCGREVWRNHYEHASDTGERCRKRIHVVVVGFEELHTLFPPVRRFLGIPYDPSNLLALCKKRAPDGTTYLPCNSHDCVHIDASWFLSWLWVTSAKRSGVGHQKIRIKLLLGQSDTAEALADREEPILLGNVAGSWKGAFLP